MPRRREFVVEDQPSSAARTAPRIFDAGGESHVAGRINFGFKDRRKIKAIVESLEHIYYTPKSHIFPLKNDRRFQLSAVYPFGTYLIHIMFVNLSTFDERKIVAYLILINGNGRYVYSELLNDAAVSTDKGGMENMVLQPPIKPAEAYTRAFETGWKVWKLLFSNTSPSLTLSFIILLKLFIFTFPILFKSAISSHLSLLYFLL
jgi:hypothetical protein